MSAKQNTRTFCGEQNVTASVLRMGQWEFTERISDILRRIASRNPGGVKHIASAANSNTRTAENWLAKQATPTARHLLCLMASDADICAEVLRLVRADVTLDPVIERLLNDIWERKQALQRLDR